VRRVTLAVLLLVGSVTLAESKYKCGASACDNAGLVADARAAVSDACPCGDAVSAAAYRKCWKPVAKDFVRLRARASSASHAARS
jgi:hypothetical protein